MHEPVGSGVTQGSLPQPVQGGIKLHSLNKHRCILDHFTNNTLINQLLLVLNI